MSKNILTEELYAEMSPLLDEIKANGWSEALMHSEHGYETEVVTSAIARKQSEQSGEEAMPFEEETVTLTKSELSTIAAELMIPEKESTIEQMLADVKAAVGISVKPVDGKTIIEKVGG